MAERLMHHRPARKSAVVWRACCAAKACFVSSPHHFETGSVAFTSRFIAGERGRAAFGKIDDERSASSFFPWGEMSADKGVTSYRLHIHDLML
jgi:hypothetical protein